MSLFPITFEQIFAPMKHEPVTNLDCLQYEFFGFNLVDAIEAIERAKTWLRR
jgi:hypothetical protein